MSETKSEITEEKPAAETAPAETSETRAQETSAVEGGKPEKAKKPQASKKAKKAEAPSEAGDPAENKEEKPKKETKKEPKKETKKEPKKEPKKEAKNEAESKEEKAAKEPGEKKGETTTTFNDETIADLAKLTALNGRGDHMQFSLGTRTSVGYGEKPDIVQGVLTLDNKILSIPQFKIEFNGWHWVLINCNLKNSTTINGEEIRSEEPVQLTDGCLIRIASGNRSQVFIFETSYDPNVEWKSYLLRNKNKPITIYSSEALRQMSDASSERKNREDYPHAEFMCIGQSWHVIDVNLDKGVTVNGRKVTGTKSCELHVYDVIRIGSTIFAYLPGRLVYNLTNGARKNLIISIADRTVNVSWNKKKVLLKDINLTIEPGNLVLLLGGSGAGKTTFINAVTGYEPANAKVLNGGVDVYENYNQMKYEIGVVPQQDLLRGTDNVYMTLYNAAELRMPAGYSPKEIAARVSEVLDMFGLLSQKDSLVKSLSGGQRKRLSIACEYIGDPSLFILDEPDSGLDGVIARELMERLRRIADSGKIVIVITHTPDRVIDLFDQVIVLAKDSNKIGRLAFFGSIADAREFFGKQKMEDIVKCVNTREEGGDGRADELIEAYENMRKKKEGEENA